MGDELRATPDPRLAALGVDRAVPFRVRTTTRFRGVTHREGWLIRGAAGWAEFSPFPEYSADVGARWLQGALAAATIPPPPAVRGTVEVNVTVPAVAPGSAAAIVAASGCTTAKVKVAEVGQDLAADCARVAAVRDALGPSGAIRVDANGAWDVATAGIALGRLDRAAAGLAYAEQPCRSVAELRSLRRATRVPIAVDESLRTAVDPLAVARSLAGAADVVILKVQPLGGAHRALRIAEEAGLPVVVSSALETSVGLAVGLELALALPALGGACGIGTATLLEADVVEDPLVAVDGTLGAAPRPSPRSIPEPDGLAALSARLVGALDVVLA